MPALRILSGALGVVLLAGPAAAQTWTAEGFSAPESVLLDAERDRFYVSNVAGQPNEKDGRGFISIVAPDGSIDNLEWVTGLDAPKGLAQRADTLFVSDIDRLVAIDVEAGEISGTWAAEGAQFLNDPVVDAEGRVFVSDMMANRIYVLEDDALSLWLEDEELQHPNGLAIEGDQLIVAAWGRNMQPDFTTEEPGHLIAVGLADKQVASYGSGEPIGNLDGIEADGTGSWLVTDWIAGALYRIDPDGGFEQLSDLNQGSADLEYLVDENTAVIPMMMNGTVVAHRLD